MGKTLTLAERLVPMFAPRGAATPKQTNEHRHVKLNGRDLEWKIAEGVNQHGHHSAHASQSKGMVAIRKATAVPRKEP